MFVLLQIDVIFIISNGWKVMLGERTRYKLTMLAALKY